MRVLMSSSRWPSEYYWPSKHFNSKDPESIHALLMTALSRRGKVGCTGLRVSVTAERHAVKPALIVERHRPVTPQISAFRESVNGKA
eukprot:288732-Pelagomonas_calceolata.AAC.2